MKPNSIVPQKYTAPGYVGAFRFAGFICILAGLALIAVALKEGSMPYAAAGWIIAGFVQFLYADIANDVARSAWQTALLAQNLGLVIDEIGLQADERIQRDRAAQRKQNEEIERVLAEREAAEDRA